mgnify:CR=1 FL=1
MKKNIPYKTIAVFDKKTNKMKARLTFEGEFEKGLNLLNKEQLIKIIMEKVKEQKWITGANEIKTFIMEELGVDKSVSWYSFINKEC